MNTSLSNQELGRCSWVPGSALKGRPGTTAEFFSILLEAEFAQDRIAVRVEIGGGRAGWRIGETR
jgi:hypothetical protein